MIACSFNPASLAAHLSATREITRFSISMWTRMLVFQVREVKIGTIWLGA